VLGSLVCEQTDTAELRNSIHNREVSLGVRGDRVAVKTPRRVVRHVDEKVGPGVATSCGECVDKHTFANICNVLQSYIGREGGSGRREDRREGGGRERASE
jgi:hypothetical protein